jgi:hypothetical protein
MLTFEQWRSKKNESMADGVDRTDRWVASDDGPVGTGNGVWHTTKLTAMFRSGKEEAFMKWFQSFYGHFGYQIKFSALPWGPKKISIFIPTRYNTDEAVMEMEEAIHTAWSEDIS